MSTIESAEAIADAIKFVQNNVETSALYVHSDRIGAPQKVTDNSGAIVWDMTADPFGDFASITGSITNNRRFPGQYFDSETGFHYNYRRDYDPAIGRYIEVDPIGIIQIKAIANSTNLYAYVSNNPISDIDPQGLQMAPSIPMEPGPLIVPPVAIPNTPENRAWTSAATQAVNALIKKFVKSDESSCDNSGACEELLRIDTDTCNAIARVRGPRAGARCHASASQRYSECLRYGVNGVHTPLDTWNN